MDTVCIYCNKLKLEKRFINHKNTTSVELEYILWGIVFHFLTRSCECMYTHTCTHTNFPLPAKYMKMHHTFVGLAALWWWQLPWSGHWGEGETGEWAWWIHTHEKPQWQTCQRTRGESTCELEWSSSVENVTKLCFFLNCVCVDWYDHPLPNSESKLGEIFRRPHMQIIWPLRQRRKI